MEAQSPFDDRIGFCFLDARSAAETCLLPAEMTLVPNGAADGYVGALTLGRAAAHRALSQMGFPADIPLLRTADHLPAWPSGLEGSISHTAKERLTAACAAVGRLTEITGVGVDVENLDRKVSDVVFKKVCTAAERAWCEEAGASRDRRALMLFSAKEAMFQAFRLIFPVGRGFQAASLRYDRGLGCLEATIEPAIPGHFPARSKHWIATQEVEGLIITALAVFPHGRRWEPRR